MVEPSNVIPNLDLTHLQQEVSGDFVVLNNNTNHIDDGLIDYADALEAIDEDKASARLNEVSMIGNDGRRIYY